MRGPKAPALWLNRARLSSRRLSNPRHERYCPRAFRPRPAEGFDAATLPMSIELKNVSKEFGDVPAVNQVSFSVRDGELMALLGPSGGGKTTVLRMIAGLETPTDGDIFIRGERVNDVSVQQRNIGFVFQSYALFRNMNVSKNIMFGLKIKKW